MRRKLVKWMENEDLVILVNKDDPAEWAELRWKKPMNETLPAEQRHDVYYFNPPEEVVNV